jgi:hypothetical protein
MAVRTADRNDADARSCTVIGLRDWQPIIA